MEGWKDSVQKRYSQFGDTKHKWRTVLLGVVLSFSLCSGQETVVFDVDPYFVNSSSTLTELEGGILSGGQAVWRAAGSPYLLRDDLLVERDGELLVEPGVEVRFAPMVGITVRGKLTAIVSTLSYLLY